MNSPSHLSDDAILERLGRRLGQLRLDQNRTQAELAEEAGVSERTLKRLEGGESTQVRNLVRVLRALDILERVDGLVPEPGPDPLRELRATEGRRRRASSTREESGPARPWTWGDVPHDPSEDR
ncbi:MAG: helix-turn-helix transcriptional regulator [Planctomycetota bacterium]